MTAASTAPMLEDASPFLPDSDEFHFEGPEKKLDISFARVEGDGLRRVPQSVWAEVCKDAKCSILHLESNPQFDAYLLSESSLFIFPERMIAKTCGQTMLLNLIPHLFTLAEAVGTRPTVLTYGHYRYRFPDEQDELHRSFTSERAHLDLLFPGAGRASTLAGGDALLSDASARCWHVYVADLRGAPQLCGPANALLFRGFSPVAGAAKLRPLPEQVDARSGDGPPPLPLEPAGADEPRPQGGGDNGNGAADKAAGYETPEQVSPYHDLIPYAGDAHAGAAAAELAAATDGRRGETVLEVAMEGLSAAFTGHFFFDGVNRRADDPLAVARASGIEALMPGVQLDPWCFDPCGFSLNGLRGSHYFTIHITPEPQMSFASFETNDPRYASDEFVSALLATFCPQHATVLVTARAANGASAAPVAECGDGVRGYRLVRATCDAFGGGKHAQAIGARCAVLEQLEQA